MITIDDIRCKHSGHFFDSATLRMFKTQVLPEVYVGIGGIFFVTSEKMSDDSPRLYTVRHFYPDTGGIGTAYRGEPPVAVCARGSKAEAKRAAAAAAAAATAGD
jgi:hypothetical protein